ncbi:DUF2637 domain-containing protein [Asanoa sp. NPDC049573]|uniref:DUF2637 domain-containing protein n=1 Tax=Asanoa sp. NPDC049573 TaxID=3155396 RepID=UPI00343D2552
MLTGLTVAGLAIVAGAISFAHMTELALKHGQAGWKAYALDISAARPRGRRTAVAAAHSMAVQWTTDASGGDARRPPGCLTRLVPTGWSGDPPR